MLAYLMLVETDELDSMPGHWKPEIGTMYEILESRETWYGYIEYKIVADGTVYWLDSRRFKEQTRIHWGE